jgi:hypothetical protein
MDNEISTKSFDGSEEKILLKGEYNNTAFIIGIVLAIICIIFSVFYIVGEQDSIFPGLDYTIIVISIIFMFICIKELVLNRKRMMCLTENRIYGNTGYKTFDILYSDITVVEERTKKSFIYGNIIYLYIKTNTNTELIIEQLKNIGKIIQLIKSKRD